MTKVVIILYIIFMCKDGIILIITSAAVHAPILGCYSSTAGYIEDSGLLPDIPEFSDSYTDSVELGDTFTDLLVDMDVGDGSEDIIGDYIDIEIADSDAIPEDDGCIPRCDDRECGVDPNCGTSCGVCSLPMSCNGAGRCREGWVTIHGGTFIMGSPITEPGRRDDETQHLVTLTHDFEIRATETTQGQFKEMMGYNPSYFTTCGLDCPVEFIIAHVAEAYCNALSASEGLPRCYDCTGDGTGTRCRLSSTFSNPYDCSGYRLPTEAEWEYAARAGTTTATYYGPIEYVGLECQHPNPVFDPIAWFCGTSSVSYPGCRDISETGGSSCSGIHTVGILEPNGWGLFDMLGNVQEWCSDYYTAYPGDVTDPWGPLSGVGMLARGGSWIENAENARAASRRSAGTTLSDVIGVRPVRSLPLSTL